MFKTLASEYIIQPDSVCESYFNDKVYLNSIWFDSTFFNLNITIIIVIETASGSTEKHLVKSESRLNDFNLFGSDSFFLTSHICSLFIDYYWIANVNWFA